MSDFTLPTSRPITQEWAQDFSWLNGTFYPNGFYSSLGWKGHNGIDYGCWVGDEVEAVCDGVVEYVGPGNNHPLLSGGGNTILLRTDKYGMRFEYLHLSQQNVYTGQQVKKGQVIGLSGNSGVSTAPHLHLGAIPVGNVNQNDGWRGRVDPTPYLYGSLALQGTITEASEEDDMSAEFERDVRAQLSKDETAFAKLDRDLRAQLQSLPSFERDVRADLAQKGQQIIALTAANRTLADLLADSKSLSIEDVRAALAGALADAVIKVDVTVDGGK